VIVYTKHILGIMRYIPYQTFWGFQTRASAGTASDADGAAATAAAAAAASMVTAGGGANLAPFAFCGWF
jgi:hypothetical protein